MRKLKQFERDLMFQKPRVLFLLKETLNDQTFSMLVVSASGGWTNTRLFLYTRVYDI